VVRDKGWKNASGSCLYGFMFCVLVCMCDGVSTCVREKSMRNTSIYFDYNDDDDHDM
jgi:hypothetical protein